MKNIDYLYYMLDRRVLWRDLWFCEERGNEVRCVRMGPTEVVEEPKRSLENKNPGCVSTSGIRIYAEVRCCIRILSFVKGRSWIRCR